MANEWFELNTNVVTWSSAGWASRSDANDDSASNKYILKPYYIRKFHEIKTKFNFISFLFNITSTKYICCTKQTHIVSKYSVVLLIF